MRPFRLLCFLLVSGCSAGSLDLTGEDPSENYYWPTPYDDGAIATEMLAFGERAEEGYVFFSTHSFDQASLRLSSYDRAVDQILLPAAPTKRIFRRGTLGYQFTYRWSSEYDFCQADSEGSVGAYDPCEENALCAAIAPEVTATTGPTPCTGRDGGYSIVYKPKALELTVDAMEPPPPLTQRTVGYLGAWRNIATEGAPPSIIDPQAFVAGTQVLVFGRSVAGTLTGGLYDPGADKWSPLGTEGFPAASGPHQALWAGNRLLVLFSGEAHLYDPATGKWTATSKDNAPNFAGSNFVAAYDDSGKRAYLWGDTRGAAGTMVSVGAVYDVTSDKWLALKTSGGPMAEIYSGAGWTGSEFLVWSNEETGRALYYPQTEEWFPLTNDVIETAASENSEGAQSRVTSYKGRVMILPEGLEFNPSVGGRWTNHEMPLGTDKGASVAITKDEMVVLGGLEMKSKRYIGRYLAPNGVALELPRSPSAPDPREHAAVLLVGDFLMVYGGCTRLVDERCHSFSNGGATVRITKGPTVPE